ncbi:MAG: 3-deoxy-D-manno-octulosonate 8-phosphate phosphatase [Gammaproteobacteria bacterium]|jgi:3-deoxy-D-manno-octulosonate 8-phosphate phosphatase (KDO 8-P phosphatase)|nr:3-deoxy-D-manno-octulosonate 8-phosphate phosphatase [Gammaproteobacteria bacterium]
MMDMQSDLIGRAKQIKLLILDVDGVLTDGKLYIGNDSEELKAFNVKDGLGMRLLMKTGVELAIITGKQSHIVQRRMQELDIKYVFQGQANKLPAYLELIKQLNLKPEQTAYMGDDLPDLPLLKRVGLATIVADANGFIVPHAHYQTQARGGKGAVREVCELIMSAQGTLQTVQESFLKDGSLLHSSKEAG